MNLNRNDLFYDSDQNITWTKDANINGVMSWNQANIWVAGLTYGGYSDWVMPNIAELSYQFLTNLGEVPGQSIFTSHNANYDLFTNIQPYVYWSGSEYASVFYDALVFGTHSGYQGYGGKRVQLYAWAVRSGDVSPVPVPGAVWLFGSGLLGLLGLKRHRTA